MRSVYERTRVRCSQQRLPLLMLCSALLDRIVELERSTRMHKDAAITSRRGTARESRLRARLLPSLNEPLKTENDPHATSRHVGPDAAHRVAQQQAAAMQYEQTLGVKSEADRAIVKLPKRARPSKGGGGGTRNATATMAASVHIFPNEPPYRTSEGEMGPVTANGGGP